MNIKKTSLNIAVVLAMGGISTGANAALLPGSILSIEAGSNFTLAAAPSPPVLTAFLLSGTQGGLIIGQVQGLGSHNTHGGVAHPAEGNLDQEWNFLGNAGQSFTTSPVSVLTDSGVTKTLDFSGWRISWNAIPSINTGGGFQDCGTTSDGICLTPGTSPVDIGGTFDNGTGIASITCSTSSCSNTSTYTLTYTAVIAQADPSNFGGITYNLNLTGIVNSVPVPAAFWLFGSGLLGLAGIAKRKSSR